MPRAGLALQFADELLVGLATLGEFLPKPLLSLRFESLAFEPLVNFLHARRDRPEVGEDAWNEDIQSAGLSFEPALAVEVVRVIGSGPL